MRSAYTSKGFDLNTCGGQGAQRLWPLNNEERITSRFWCAEKLVSSYLLSIIMIALVWIYKTGWEIALDHVF
jgi:hypothetical protein